MNNTAKTALDNAISLMQIIHVGIDAMPSENRLADGLGRVIDHLAAELETAQQALG